MNRITEPNAEHAASPATVGDVSPAAKAAPVVAKPATALAPSKVETVAKAARVGRLPAAKKAVVKRVAAPKIVKSTVAKVAAPAVKRLPAVKPATAAKAVAAGKPVAAVKEKAKKAKLVRDSFTMPEDEFSVLGKVKKASLKAGINVKKSELLRVGVALVDQLSVAQLRAALASLMPLKAGRPKKDK